MNVPAFQPPVCRCTKIVASIYHATTSALSRITRIWSWMNHLSAFVAADMRTPPWDPKKWPAFLGSKDRRSTRAWDQVKYLSSDRVHRGGRQGFSVQRF